MILKICGRYEVPEFSGQGFSHMISVGDSNDYFDGLRLPNICEADHIILRFTDTEDLNHPDAPSLERMAELLPWLSTTTKPKGLLVHCAGGISRSPAVALLAMCYFFPETKPIDLMRLVARSAECSYVWPNQAVVEIGDTILQHQGEIVDDVRKWKDEQDEDMPLHFL